MSYQYLFLKKFKTMKFELKHMESLGKQLSKTSYIKISSDKTLIELNSDNSFKNIETKTIYEEPDKVRLNIFDFEFAKHLHRFDQSEITDIECAAFLKLIRENKVRLIDELNFFTYDYLYDVPMIKYVASKLSKVPTSLVSEYRGDYDTNLSYLNMDNATFDVKKSLIKIRWTPVDFIMLFNMIISNPRNSHCRFLNISKYIDYLWKHLNLTFKYNIRQIGTPSMNQLIDDWEMSIQKNRLLRLMFDNISTPFICELFATHYESSDNEAVLEMMYLYCTNSDTLDQIYHERVYTSRFKGIKVTDKMKTLLDKNFNKNVFL